jgi:hypothetical protein
MTSHYNYLGVLAKERARAYAALPSQLQHALLFQKSWMCLMYSKNRGSWIVDRGCIPKIVDRGSWIVDVLDVFCTLFDMEVNLAPHKTCVVCFRPRHLKVPAGFRLVFRGREISL